jgi:RHS repeat-associated protein
MPGLYEKRTVGTTTKHVFYVQGTDGAAAQVVYDGLTTDIQYQLTDQLGSVSAVVGSTGAVKQSLFYDPFGARLNSDGTPFAGDTGDVTHGYTGHEHDDDLGLINMKGRVYDPALKRFLTPDPVVADIGDSQSWNPYSYVNNSPLNRTDPTGSVPCGPRPPFQTAPEDCTNMSGNGVNNGGAAAQTAWLGIGSSSWMGSDTSKLWAEANKRAAVSDSTVYHPGGGDSGTGTVYEGELTGGTSENAVFDQDSTARTILIVQDGQVVAVCNSGGCVPSSQASYAPGSSQPISGAETASTDPSGSAIGFDGGLAAQGLANLGTVAAVAGTGAGVTTAVAGTAVTIVVGSFGTGMLGGALVQNHLQDSMFGAGQYTPQTPSGVGLLAHELAHVAQPRPAP